MNHNFSSLQQVLELFHSHEVLGAGEIAEKLGKSKVLAHRYINALLKQGKLKKIGKAPYTKYKLSSELAALSLLERKIEGASLGEVIQETVTLDFKTRKTLDEVFLKFSPTGKKLEGFVGLQEWCFERNLDISTKIQDYLQIVKYIESRQNICGLLSADNAFGKDFEEKYLDTVLYADQYNYMDFGRGKLAELTFYAKQSQNKKLIAESIAEIFPKLECLIHTESFDAIAMTPWSIVRKNQLLGALKKELCVFEIPFIGVIKYSSSGIFIPQKSLKTRGERIQNAKNTIFINDDNTQKYKKVLLIDDFVGSGATLNETAKKLKEAGVKEVYGFAFVGNTNLSYEVIREI